MFKFRLQTLLRMRLAERDQRRAELAKALRAEEVLRAEEQQLAKQQAEQAELGRKLKGPGVADIDALMRTHRYELVLIAHRRQLQSQLEQVAAETERRRRMLVEADRQVRVLEKLSERQAAAYKLSAERVEAKQFDELAAIGYLRQREARV